MRGNQERITTGANPSSLAVNSLNPSNAPHVFPRSASASASLVHRQRQRRRTLTHSLSLTTLTHSASLSHQLLHTSSSPSVLLYPSARLPIPVPEYNTKHRLTHHTFPSHPTYIPLTQHFLALASSGQAAGLPSPRKPLRRQPVPVCLSLHHHTPPRALVEKH